MAGVSPRSFINQPWALPVRLSAGCLFLVVVCLIYWRVLGVFCRLFRLDLDSCYTVLNDWFSVVVSLFFISHRLACDTCFPVSAVCLLPCVCDL